MKINGGRLKNLEITRDEDSFRQTIRLSFDVVTEIGEFHYESDYRSVDEMSSIIAEFGLSHYALLINGRMPTVDLDIAFKTGSDAY